MMCFLSVESKLQMLMERLLLAIVSLMIFQLFESLYSKNKEYKDFGKWNDILKRFECVQCPCYRHVIVLA